MPTPTIRMLRDAIRAQHHADAVYFSTDEVALEKDGSVYWHGTVHVFDVLDHPKAKRAYAWTYATEDGDRAIAVLGVPPIDSATKAAEAALVALARKKTVS